MKGFIASLSILMVLMFVGCASAPEAAEGTDEAVAAAVDVVPEGETEVLEDFEDGLYWDIMADTGALLINLTDGENVISGTTSAELVFKETTWACWYTNQPMIQDWTGVNYFVVDINNTTDKTIEMGMVMMTTDGWVWQQTPSVKVMPGTHPVVFNLTDGTFINTKLIGSADNPEGKVAVPFGIEDVKYVGIVIHKADTDGTLFIDNVRLIK